MSPNGIPVPVMNTAPLIIRAIQMPSALNRCPFTSWPKPGMKKENNAGIPWVLLQQFMGFTFFERMMRERI